MLTYIVWKPSVPKRGISGQKLDKVGYLIQQIIGKLVMIWRGPIYWPVAILHSTENIAFNSWDL